MSKSKSSDQTDPKSGAPAGKAKGKGSSDSSPPARRDGFRETVESVVVAFILAFLFRTFEAEAFVIPTGSMAPTLFGRHKEVDCEKCGFHFQIGASDEIDGSTGYYKPGSHIDNAYCPNCRYRNDIENVPVFKGDRILVNKFPFEFGEPSRWDVTVFKYPEDPKTNYIKRLVGLPGEIIMIQQGNLYARTDAQGGEWKILRKENPNKQRNIQLLVYDDRHAERPLHAQGWPERWAAVRRSTSPGGRTVWNTDEKGWQADPRARTYRLDADSAAENAAADRMTWLRYRHILPTQEDWGAVDANPPLAPNPDPRPQLITDYCGYNAYDGGHHSAVDQGIFWVGDLTLNCHIEIGKVQQQAEVVLELVEGFRWYRCRFDVATGKATLSYVDRLLAPNDGTAKEVELASAETDLKGAGNYEITFANVDDRLCLWVDDSLIDFGKAAEYKPVGLPAPTTRDLTPVGIAASGVDVTVSELVIQRDIYYRSELLNPEDQYLLEHEQGRSRTISEYDGSERNLLELVHQPDKWYQEYSDLLSVNQKREGGDYENVSFVFELGADEYLMLGDNSPRSKDSRLWSNTRHAEHRHAVPRSALVGKAFFIYWPHGVPFMNNGHGHAVTYHKSGPGESTEYPQHRIPFYPQVGRMRRIR